MFRPPRASLKRGFRKFCHVLYPLKDTSKCLQHLPRASPTSFSLGRELSFVADGDGGRTSSGSPVESPTKVGFVGLGNMGSHMAANVLLAGWPLVVHDRNVEAVAGLVDKGASSATSAAELAEEADVVITMLPSSPHVEDVYMGPKGLLANRAAVHPWLLLDASTVDPRTCRTLAAFVAECRLSRRSPMAKERASPLLLDAPVSGGVVGAKAGSLTFMAAKLCNNLALAIQMAGVAEALALGHKLGLDVRQLSHIFNSSTARSWSSEVYNPVPGVMEGVPSSRAYLGGFSCQLMVRPSPVPCIPTPITLSPVARHPSRRPSPVTLPLSPVTHPPSPVICPPSPCKSVTCHLLLEVLPELSLPSSSSSPVPSRRRARTRARTWAASVEAPPWYERMCGANAANKDFSCIYEHIYGGGPAEELPEAVGDTWNTLEAGDVSTTLKAENA
eukprot:jgi/Mesen1/6987/ME000364S06167